MAEMEPGAAAEGAVHELFDCVRSAESAGALNECLESQCQTLVANTGLPWRVTLTVGMPGGKEYRHKHSVERQFTWNGRYREEVCLTLQEDVGTWWTDEYILNQRPDLATVWGPRVVWAATGQRVMWTFGTDRRSCSVSEAGANMPPIWLKIGTVSDVVRAAVAFEVWPVAEWLNMPPGTVRVSENGAWEGLDRAGQRLRQAAERGVSQGLWSVRLLRGMMVAERVRQGQTTGNHDCDGFEGNGPVLLDERARGNEWQNRWMQRMGV